MRRTIAPRRGPKSWTFRPENIHRTYGQARCPAEACDPRGCGEVRRILRLVGHVETPFDGRPRHRLDRIDPKALSAADRTNRAILRRQLAEQVEGNRFGQRAVTFTTYSSWFQNIAGLGEDLPFQTKADYESYLTRLAAYPAYNDAQIEVTRRGLREGCAQPCAPL